MPAILIKGGHVIDPANGVDEVRDVFIEDGVISSKGDAKDAQVIDASGMIVTPGLFDMHEHLREPGREDKETIETGLRAALHGGITAVLSMPNTTPQADNQTVIEFQINRAKQLKLGKLFVAGRITKCDGKLAEMWELKKSGAVAVTDDGHDVDDEGLLLSGLEWAHTFGIPLLTHAEMGDLSRGGVINEGRVSQLMGLEGAPASSEILAIERTLRLGEEVGTRVHITHLSTAGGVEAVRQAKARGVHATAEACPHHFGLTDEECLGYRTNAKMYPPLRTEEDRQAICEGLKDGTIDVIATDHAPHLVSEKLLPFVLAPNGTIGSETMFAATVTYLVDTGILSLAQAIEKMTIAPAKVLGLEIGTLSDGAAADVAVFDPGKEWTVDPTTFETKGRASSFEGKKLKGVCEYVWVDGERKVENGEVL